jgi:arylsulfatase
MLVLIALPNARAASPATNSKPNIVIILTDDQGYGDVGVFGAKGFQTPNLDRLASEGTIFRNFHDAQPVCSASRCALLTGCYPNRLGIHGALGPRSSVGLSAEETTLAELLKQHGYRTAIFGKWHLGDALEFLPTRHGFDEYFGLPYSNDMWPLHPDIVKASQQGIAPRVKYPELPLLDGEKAVIQDVTHEHQNQLTTWYTEHAVKFIEQNRGKPFFLYLAHNSPHVPLHVSDKFRGKSAQGLYGDVIEEIDWSVGQVLEALKRWHLEENTWIIFTSDNGPWLSYGNHAGSAGPLREGKGTNWEGGTRVPCIMRWPGRIPARGDSGEMLMTIDLLPTIAGRIGAELPAHTIDGLDAWPLISHQSGAKNPHSGYWFYYEVNQLQAVTTGDGHWKLQLPHTYRTMRGQTPGHDGFPGPYRNLKVERAELYDLVSDMGETTDMSASYPGIVQQLEREAQKARKELGDALTGRTGSGQRQPAHPARAAR